MKWSWRIGRILGIDVKLHMTFLLLLGWVGVRFGRFKDHLYAELGSLKYTVVMVLFLTTVVAVLGKIALRLLFGIKYILSFPGVNFNI